MILDLPRLSLQLQSPPAAAGSWSFLIGLLPYALILVVFYFLLIAPARKRQKQTQQLLDNLKNGDKVITSGGLYGTVVRANKGEDPIRVRVAASVEVDLARAAVTGLQPEPPKGA